MNSNEKTEWTLQDVRDELARGSRVLLVVRHAERPKIGYEDKTFGGSLPLTPAGERMSEEFGRILRGAAESVQFRASPLLRTVMTARLAAKGMGLEDADIPEDATIGNSSAFVESELDMWELFRDGKFFEHMSRYMNTGIQKGFAPLAAAADAYEERLLSLFSAKLGIFATHDVFVAAYLHARGVKRDFCRENWPRFMDSAAIVLDADGLRRYALVRAGLSTLCTGV